MKKTVMDIFTHGGKNPQEGKDFLNWIWIQESQVHLSQ